MFFDHRQPLAGGIRPPGLGVAGMRAMHHERLFDGRHIAERGHLPEQIPVFEIPKTRIEAARLPQQLAPTKTAREDEVRSIAEVGYQLVTGLLPVKPVIPVEHMIEHIDQTWRDYFQTGLGSPGYSTAAHALAAVQGLRIAGGGGIGGMGNSLRELVKSLLAPVR